MVGGELSVRFELFLPLHHLWLGYMSELLGLPPPQSTPLSTHLVPSSASMHAKLIKADFHGSIMTGTASALLSRIFKKIDPRVVHQSKNPCLVGLSGIVIHETENAFRVVTQKDQAKGKSTALFHVDARKFLIVVLPKQNSIFTFAVPLYSTLPLSSDSKISSGPLSSVSIDPPPVPPLQGTTVLDG